MLDMNRLLLAIAEVETSGGINNWPRIEASYLPLGFRCTAQGRLITGSGRNFNRIVESRWETTPEEHRLGTAASWSKWQILYHTARDCGYENLPYNLHDDAVALPWVRRRLEVLWNHGARTPQDFARGWNGGNIHAKWVPDEYIAKFMKAWERLA